MEVYTTGFAKKSAAQFFETLKKAEVERLIDVRLNNTSQLSGFTKREDLRFFLREIYGTEYIHLPLLAPTQDLLSAYKSDGMSWQEYEHRFLSLMRQRRIQDELDKDLFGKPTVLLCSERTPEHCHRRLVLEYLDSQWGDVHITHL